MAEPPILTEEERAEIISDFIATTFPLTISPRSMGYKMLEETSIPDLKKLMTFHLKNILLTCPGERINLPDFGVCVRKYLFEQENNLNTEILKTEILNQIAENAPYIKVNFIDTVIIPEDHLLKITISYFVNLKNSINSLEDILEFVIDEQGSYQTNPT